MPEALAPLGEDYISTLKHAFKSRWIDIYENKGKRSGAYSWGIYGVHPYVLLNYQPRYNSISTIAHEMGHAMHSYLANQAQTYTNSDYSIFCAEVASTTNEILLLEHTLANATAEQKIYLINQFLEAVRTTVYRQVQFAEFELYTHGEINAGRSLQAENLENYWLESNKTYYGPPANGRAFRIFTHRFTFINTQPVTAPQRLLPKQFSAAKKTPLKNTLAS